VIPRFCTEKELTIYGDGGTVRDFTYVDDVSRAVSLAISLEHSNFCMNVGSGVGTTVAELAGLLSKDRPIIYKEARPGEARESIASIKNLQRIFNLKSTTTLTEGLRKTEEYYNKWVIQNQLVHGSQGKQEIQKEAQP
jgi:nucleoside-diphosphate-sugar epimerase